MTIRRNWCADRVQMENYLADLDNIVVRLVPIYRVHVVQFNIENRGHSTHSKLKSDKISRPTRRRITSSLTSDDGTTILSHGQNLELL